MGRTVFEGGRAYFPSVKQIRYEGPGSDNPLAFKVYEADRVVAGKTMAEHLRFAVAYWHTLLRHRGRPVRAGHARSSRGTRRPTRWTAAEGPSSTRRSSSSPSSACRSTASTTATSRRRARPSASPSRTWQRMVELAKERQQATGVKLLWGTANLFSHPRYMNGAATNPDFAVVAHAAAQVKAAIDATMELGGEDYVFWGGREGYSTLLQHRHEARAASTSARFLAMARDYARTIGFKGVFFIEPKPMEPIEAPVRLRRRDRASASCASTALDKDFKLNIEANHATLAGHTFAHELQVAADAGLLGSIDANRGDAQNGWDTDQFPDRPVRRRRGDVRRAASTAACTAAASTSTPRCGASRPTSRTCSSPTSAAWTPSRAAS